MTVLDDLVTRAKANSHDISGGPARAENNMRRRIFHVAKEADDAAAGTATAERAVFRVPTHLTNGIQIVSVHYAADGAITADDTNYATLTFSKRDGVGGGATVVSTQTTKITGGSGNVTAHVPILLTNSTTLADLQLAAGAVLTELISKTGTGVAVQAGCFTVVYDEL